jgi:hypothetical protein
MALCGTESLQISLMSRDISKNANIGRSMGQMATGKDSVDTKGRSMDIDECGVFAW